MEMMKKMGDGPKHPQSSSQTKDFTRISSKETSNKFESSQSSEKRKISHPVQSLPETASSSHDQDPQATSRRIGEEMRGNNQLENKSGVATPFPDISLSPEEHADAQKTLQELRKELCDWQVWEKTMLKLKEVKQELDKTEHLKHDRLLPEEYTVLKQLRDILEKHSDVLQKLNNTCSDLIYKRDMQKTPDNLRKEIKTLQEESDTLQKHFEVLQNFNDNQIKLQYSSLEQEIRANLQATPQDLPKRHDTQQELRSSDVSPEKRKNLQMDYHNLQMQQTSDKIKHLDGSDISKQPSAEASNHLGERNKNMYRDTIFSLTSEEHTDPKRHLELLKKYQEAVKKLPNRMKYLEGERDNLKTMSYESLKIYEQAIQELFDNQDKLKCSNLSPEKHDNLEICEKACKYGKKLQEILDYLALDNLADYKTNEHKRILYKIAQIHWNYLQDLWQQKNAISSSFSEHSQNKQAIIQQHSAWKEASQEREKCLNALGTYPTIHEWWYLYREHVDRAYPSFIKHTFAKFLYTDFRALKKILQNLDYLADECRSDNDEHLQKVKNSRMKRIEAQAKLIYPYDMRTLIPRPKAHNILKKWHKALKLLHSMHKDANQNLTDDQAQLLFQSIEKQEKAYNDWETRRTSTFRWKDLF